MPTQGPAWDLSGLFSHPLLQKWQFFQHLSQSVSTCPFTSCYSSQNPADDSLRVAAAGQLLYPPYTRLGWDQNADALSDVSANDVAQFGHIAGFGRPLYVFLFSYSFGFIDQQL